MPDELLPSLRAFHIVLDEIEPAKAGLTDIVPGTRLPGRPLQDALEEFVARLTRARDAMPAWRRPELEDEWSACRDGLEIALLGATELLEDDYEAAGFGSLLEVVERSLDPLEPFARAEERFASLRRRKGRSRAKPGEPHGASW
ncbi:MAG: hypothetical protein E6G43_05150 [Actinobacteria bacterium]|nr:MAG: hypothetical protein E6G43_05150 [Actinomycetota bacterium]